MMSIKFPIREENSRFGSLFRTNPKMKPSNLEKKEQQETPIDLPSSGIDPADSLLQLFARNCATVYERYSLLEERDKILCKSRVKFTDVDSATVIAGVCHDMCSEKERYIREVQKRISPYECDSFGNVDPQLTVKDYSRSAADQEEPLPHELRPASVLVTTMDYLLSKTPQIESDLPVWYDFLWNRTRAIRKDITQQMLINETAVNLIEKCARFHIFAAHRLCEFDFNEFDQKMNTENLTKCLQSLRHLYEDLAKKTIFCANETEFRAYDIMLNLNDSNILRHVLSYRSAIRQSQSVCLALRIFTAFRNNNYVQFFRLIRYKADYLSVHFEGVCLCHRYFYQVRYSALKTIATTCILNGPYPVSDLTSLLSFENNDLTVSFADIYGIKCSREDPSVFLMNRCKFMVPESDVIVYRSLWIEKMRDSRTVGQILNGGPVFPPQLPIPVISFDIDGNYLYDPILEQYTKNDAQLDANSFQRARQLTEEEIGVSENLLISIVEEIIVPIINKLVNENLLGAISKRFFDDLLASVLRIQIKNAYHKQQNAELNRLADKEKRRKNEILLIISKKFLLTLLSEVTAEMLENIAKTLISSIRLLGTRALILEMTNNFYESLCSETIMENINEKCVQMFKSQVSNRKSALISIREKLDKLWQKQFIDRWRNLVEIRRKKRRTLQHFPLMPCGNLELLPRSIKRRRLSYPGEISHKLDRFLEKTTKNAVSILRGEKLAVKYGGKWLEFAAMRKRRRNFLESFPMKPMQDTFSLPDSFRRRIPAEWQKAWQEFATMGNSIDTLCSQSASRSNGCEINIDAGSGSGSGSGYDLSTCGIYLLIYQFRGCC